MSEKEMKDQSVDAAVDAAGGKETAPARKDGGTGPAKSREDRLADALRANLRRRKSAAKSRQDD